MQDEIKKQNRSLIISCDVDFKKTYQIIKDTNNIPGISGYRITGSYAVWETTSLSSINENIINFSDSMVRIYDHQSIGLESPHYAKYFMKKCKEANFNAVVISAFGEKQEDISKLESWINAAFENKLKVIVAPLLSSEIKDKTHLISVISYNKGVRAFKLKIDEGLVNYLNNGLKFDADFYFSGFGHQEANKLEFDEMLGDWDWNNIFEHQKETILKLKEILTNRNWHIIIGWGIYNAEDPRAATMKYVKLLS